MADAPAPDRARAPYSLVGTGRKEVTLPQPEKSAEPEESAEQPKRKPYREFTATNTTELHKMLDDLIASDLGAYGVRKKE